MAVIRKWNDESKNLTDDQKAQLCLALFKILDMICFDCWFVGFHPTREYFTHMEASPLPMKGWKFWPMLVLMSSGFFSVPHLLWLRRFVYNGHLRGPATLTPITERLAVELSLFLRLRSVAARIRTPNLPFARQTL